MYVKADDSLAAAFGDGTATVEIASTNAISLSTWHHVAFSVTDTGTATLYLDSQQGVLFASVCSEANLDCLAQWLWLLALAYQVRTEIL